MTDKSRRNFIQKSAAIAGMAGVTPLVTEIAKAQETENNCDVNFDYSTSAKNPYKPVKILDTNSMPWSPPFNDRGWKAKFLYDNKETGDHLVMIEVPIGAPGGYNHYHDFHEWAYWLSGDFVNNEFTHPMQRTGAFQQFREGVFLDRPAFSLHGGEEGRLDSQVGGTCLIMEEGGTTFYIIPEDPEYSGEQWKSVKQWSVPRIIDTLSELPWENYHLAEDILVKRLVTDQLRGFRATMWQTPPGWEKSGSSDFGKAYYYKEAHQFNFILGGDLRIQSYESRSKKAENVHLAKSYYFERQPMCIFGLADGPVSDHGCVWLEVTYGKGTSIQNVPIEEPEYI
jgi:hypothetical protein